MDKPGLYLLPSPLGNLADITLRTIRLLEKADLVLAEDTRRSLKLLNHLQLKIPLLSYRAENHQTVWPRILAALAEGKILALLTDAGSPAISDPGAELVRNVRAHGFAVFPLPGPSAVITALMASGFSADRFSFGGFLPSKKNERQKFIIEFKDLPHTLVFFESPHRLAASLADLAEILGPRPSLLAREMTKIHEEYFFTNLDILRDDVLANPRKGEITIVIEGQQESAKIACVLSDDEILSLAKGDLRPTKIVASELAAKSGRSRSEIYQLLLTLKDK